MVVVTISILVKPQLSRGVHPLVARLVLLLPEGPVESEEAKRTMIKSNGKKNKDFKSVDVSTNNVSNIKLVNSNF